MSDNAAVILEAAWRGILRVEGAGEDLEKMHADMLLLFAMRKMQATWGDAVGLEVAEERIADMKTRAAAYAELQG